MYYENFKMLSVLRKLYDSYLLLSGGEKEIVLQAIKAVVSGYTKDESSTLNTALYLHQNGFNTFEVEEILQPSKLPPVWYVTGEL